MITMNNDLIRRQAALDAVEKNSCNTQRIYEALKGLPSAEPLIIHCKDCKYYEKGVDRLPRFCMVWANPVTGDDYCSKAREAGK